MTQDDGIWQKLNAYVDGELSAKEKAAVAEDIAADPDLARGVAVLHAVKAELADFQVEQAQHRRRAGVLPRRLAPYLTAACLLLLVAGGVVYGQRFDAPVPGPLLAEHLAWASAETAVPATQPEAGIARAFFGPQLPSLEPFGLRLDVAGLVSLSGEGEALHAGYVGRRGCRVSLFLVPKDEAGIAADFPPHVLHAEGEAGRWHYYLLAQDMDAARFALIDRAMAEQLRLLAPLSKDSRLAYEADPASRLPCLV